MICVLSGSLTFWQLQMRGYSRSVHPQGYLGDKCPELHKIDRAFVLLTAERIGHFPLLKSLKTQRQTDLLCECSVAAIFSDTSHKQLSNKGTLKNKPVKSFRKWFTMSGRLTDYEYQLFFSLLVCTCRLCRHQMTSKCVKRLFKRRKVLCKWLSEYLIEWFTLLRLCTSPQDNYVCSSSYRITSSFSLPPAFLSSPLPAVFALLLSFWLTSSFSLPPFFCHLHHPLWLTFHQPWCFHLHPQKHVLIFCCQSNSLRSTNQVMCTKPFLRICSFVLFLFFVFVASRSVQTHPLWTRRNRMFSFLPMHGRKFRTGPARLQ